MSTPYSTTAASTVGTTNVGSRREIGQMAARAAGEYLQGIMELKKTYKDRRDTAAEELYDNAGKDELAWLAIQLASFEFSEKMPKIEKL